MKLKSALRRFLICFVCCTLFFGTAELICRFRNQFKTTTQGSIFEYDSRKIFKLKSSFVGTFHGKIATINSDGYRGPELQAIKDPKHLRILALGDSVTFGHGVEDNETYPYFLASELTKRLGQTVEVLNSGVPTYSPFQEYVDLEKGLNYHPDAVVIQFSLNDVVEPFWIFKKFGGKGDFHNIPEIPGIDYFLSTRSAFYSALKGALNFIKFGTTDEEAIRRYSLQFEKYHEKKLLITPVPNHIAEAWEEALRWITKSISLAKEHHLPVLLVISPASFQAELPLSAALPQIKMTEFAREMKIESIDLLEVLFRSALQGRMGHENGRQLSRNEIDVALKQFNATHLLEMDKLWKKYFFDEHHCNKEGNRLVATIVADRLSAMHVLKPL